MKFFGKRATKGSMLFRTARPIIVEGGASGKKMSHPKIDSAERGFEYRDVQA
jgi:hypothetical protein